MPIAAIVTANFARFSHAILTLSQVLAPSRAAFR